MSPLPGGNERALRRMRVLDLKQRRWLAARAEYGDVGYAVAPVRKRQPPFGNRVGGSVEEVEQVVVPVGTTRPRDELGGARALFVEVPRGMPVSNPERAIGAGSEPQEQQIEKDIFPLLVLPRSHASEST